jgi:hypothetical protein
MFKKDEPTDIQLVYKACSWLGISEFQVFCDAWQEWYNEEPSEKRIESHFIKFLEHDAVPFWVRSYVRSILSRDDLLEKEKKRLLIGAITYYFPLLVFLMLLLWAFSK